MYEKSTEYEEDSSTMLGSVTSAVWTMSMNGIMKSNGKLEEGGGCEKRGGDWGGGGGAG